MPSIETPAQLQAMLVDRPAATLTYKMSDEVCSAISSGKIVLDDPSTQREMTAEEVRELEEFLEEPAGSVMGPCHVPKSFACEGCSRRMTITDFVKTVVSTGTHPKKMVADILCGRNGAWITVAGRDSARIVHCAECGLAQEYYDHNYSTSRYGYA